MVTFTRPLIGQRVSMLGSDWLAGLHRGGALTQAQPEPELGRGGEARDAANNCCKDMARLPGCLLVKFYGGQRRSYLLRRIYLISSTRLLCIFLDKIKMFLHTNCLNTPTGENGMRKQEHELYARPCISM